MVNVGDKVFVNEIVHTPEGTIEVSSVAFVTAVTDSAKGYGKDQEFVTVTVLENGGGFHSIELNHGTGVGEWNETAYTEPTSPPPATPVVNPDGTPPNFNPAVNPDGTPANPNPA